MNQRKPIILKAYFIATLLLVVAIAVFARIIDIQSSPQAEKYKELAEHRNFRINQVVAKRGNLYSSDGVLLSTTIIKYDIYVDFKTIKKELFERNISSLADSLAMILPKSKSEILAKFRKEYRNESQYVKIIKNLNYHQFNRIKNFPIFNKGKHKGGFIVERHQERIHPISGFGARTLGFDNERGKAGIEGGVSQYIKGKNGKRFEQRITNTLWKPVEDESFDNVEPIDGNDVVTTIDMRIQDIAFNALRNALIQYKASHGCVIVMEVATGKIKAMANLQSDGNGNYDDVRNFAVWEASEPGSTFKVMSLLAAMDDGYITPETTVEIGKEGYWKFFNETIKDDHIYRETYNITDVLTYSSNVGVAKIIYKYYGKSPENFIRKINNWNLNQKTGIEIPGESSPYIPTETQAKQSKHTLPWMAHGYNLKLTPLQTLTFYNAIANNGIMVKPTIVERVEQNGKIIQDFKPQIINQKVASEKARAQMITMLTQVVERGTSKSIFTPNLKMSGKTGTTKLEYWKGFENKFLSSFCGFFPSDAPKYSCIVTISNPDSQIGYYGGKVAAPVFKEIAGKVYLKTPYNIPEETNVKINYNLLNYFSRNSHFQFSPKAKFIPEVVGLYGEEVIPQLENAGLKVKYKGSGKIIKQSLPKGFRFYKGNTIYLELE